MVKTIGNPLSWGAAALSDAGHAIETAAENIGSHHQAMPDIRPLTLTDIRMALRKGIDDFAHFRSDVMAMALLYPAIGILLAFAAFHRDMLHLFFPMAAGFALIGPFVATGLYELSRRREVGEPASWAQALAVFRPAVAGPVLALGLYLAVIYAIWLYAAAWIYEITMGPALPDTLRGFVTEVTTTSEGYAMMSIGLAVGLVFALLVLFSSLISFPMLIDRRVGLPVAVAASFRLARQSPRAVCFWGLTVAAILIVASIPAFLGLILALPILGHATWHLYRATVRFPD